MRYRDYAKHFFIKGNIKMMNESFSQEGEDVLVKLFIEENKINQDGKGIYVDLGAHHPFRYSNTAALYSIGWHGINVDANEECIKLFNKYRKRDINIGVGVADKEAYIDYYCFNDSALNTFDKSLIEFNKKIGFDLVGTKKVKVVGINDLLEQNLLEGQRIDLLNIDIEGYDEIIIKSLDWEKYCPTIVLVERDMLSDNNKIVADEHLCKFGYRLYASTNRTRIYVRELV